MRSKTSLLERIGLVLVGTIVVVGITAGAAFANILEFTIDEDATLAPGGLQVVVTGTLQCTSGNIARVQVVVSQDRGQQVATAFGFTPIISCDGSIQTWGVTVDSSTPFKNGPAGGRATALSAGVGGSDSATVADRLHLN